MMLRALTLLVCLLAASVAHAADEVRVRFSWKLKSEYAPFFLAEQSGAYARRGLAVRLGEGAGAPAALGALMQGQEDLVVLPGIMAVDAMERGMPIQLIALYHPTAPVAVVGQPGTVLAKPADMLGKKMAASVGATGATYLPPFCAINKIDCSKITRIQMDSSVGSAAFLQGQLDMTILYLNVELPLYEEKTGRKFPVMKFADWGLPVPGLAVVATKTGIQRRSEVFKRVLAANHEAMQVAAKDTAAAVAATQKSWSTAPSADVVARQVEATMAAVTADVPGKPVGWIDAARIASARTLLEGTQDRSGAPDSAFFTNALLGD